MKEGGYDFGVAWDGDYDRCFFFDEHGNFIEGYYIVGLLAQALLATARTRRSFTIRGFIWNTLDIVKRLGGRAVVCKSGHAFIKEKMRAEDAIYGGEMSAHHYFKDHWYCDSGMIPFLLVAKLVSQSGRSLGDLVGEMIEKYPCSGEMNAPKDVKEPLDHVEAIYPDGKSTNSTVSASTSAMAVQPPRFEHRARHPPKRGNPRRQEFIERKDRRNSTCNGVKQGALWDPSLPTCMSALPTAMRSIKP